MCSCWISVWCNNVKKGNPLQFVIPSFIILLCKALIYVVLFLFSQLCAHTLMSLAESTPHNSSTHLAHPKSLMVHTHTRRIYVPKLPLVQNSFSRPCLRDMMRALWSINGCINTFRENVSISARETTIKYFTRERTNNKTIKWQW